MGVVLVVSTWAASANDYLPAVGPVPLRFREPPPPLLPAACMVPQPAPPRPPPTVEKNPPTATAAPAAPAAPIPVETPKANAAAAVVPPPLPALPPPDRQITVVTAPPGPMMPRLPPPPVVGADPQVTPLMLINYFKPDNTTTGAAGATIPVPVEFVPPALIPKPQSTATYISQ